MEPVGSSLLEMETRECGNFVENFYSIYCYLFISGLNKNNPNWDEGEARLLALLEKFDK